MAKTGYGKRPAGDEDPHADPDFAHLSPRDREIAVFVDHLEEGHAMGYKAIASVHPRYGQQAVRTSLRSISDAGHSRQIREHITVEDNSMRWVTRTYWSRTRRSPEWWAEFARERKGRIVTDDYRPGLARTDEPEAPIEEPTEEPAPQETGEQPEPEPERTAYRTLAQLRDADPRMPLSDSDCRSLETLVGEWLSRGSTPGDITKALTDGLPPAVTNPGGLARRRLEDKMPPKKAKIRQKAAPRRARVDRVIMCCISCDADELTTKIDGGGMCPDCRAEYEADLAAEAAGQLDAGYVPATFLADPDPVYEVVDVARRAAEVRAAGGLRSKAERAL
ncbi:hypothetical protein [Streptomyces sp. NRRL S-474]|uniref:hypothetical protein n=1 Tax=Streptomyces sp. NRRL S-474 TaxID=1463909 RepID=UPI0007C45604|nr:hypothetical protein [Streptomyces sp. NRRL S-474]